MNRAEHLPTARFSLLATFARGLLITFAVMGISLMRRYSFLIPGSEVTLSASLIRCVQNRMMKDLCRQFWSSFLSFKKDSDFT